MTDIEDKKQPGRINAMLYQLMVDAFYELQRNIRIGMKDTCRQYRALQYQVELQSIDYPQARSIYDSEQEVITRKYGTSSNMTVPELLERLQSSFNLLNRIGSFRLHERWTKPLPIEANDIAITYFEYDTSHISDDEPLVRVLTKFYYEELKKEYEDKPDVLRRKESKKRAKRACEFYRRYEKYRESGFDTDRIEEIFGITIAEQKFLKFWIDEFLHDGKATVLFASTGSGKTNLGSVVIQVILILKPEWDVGTNIPMLCAPEIQEYMDLEYREILKSYQIPKVRIVSNFTQLINLITENMLLGRYTAGVLDELDSTTIGTQSRSKEGISFQAFTWVERHLDMEGPLLVYHEQAKIPVGLRTGGITHRVFGMYTYVNYVNHRQRRAVSRPDFWNGELFLKMYFPPPLTSLPYHAQGWSSFILDVDMQWVNQRVGNVPKLEAAKRIREMVKGRGWEKERKGEIKKGGEE